MAKSPSIASFPYALKKPVAVKTFEQWNDQQVEFLEVDLVAHCPFKLKGIDCDNGKEFLKARNGGMVQRKRNNIHQIARLSEKRSGSR